MILVSVLKTKKQQIFNDRHAMGSRLTAGILLVFFFNGFDVKQVELLKSPLFDFSWRLITTELLLAPRSCYERCHGNAKSGSGNECKIKYH